MSNIKKGDRLNVTTIDQLHYLILQIK